MFRDLKLDHAHVLPEATIGRASNWCNRKKVITKSGYTISKSYVKKSTSRRRD